MDMEDRKYQVLFYGELLPGADPEEVKENLSRAFKIDRKRIEPLFSGGKKVVKKNAAREVCEKTKKMFEAAGAVAAVVPQVTEKIQPSAPPAPDPDGIFINFTDGGAATFEDRSEDGTGIRETAPPADGVSKNTLLLLTFFLGGFGVHKFYLARYIQGTIYLLFCWTGIPGLISLIEFIIYAVCGEENLQRRYRAGSTPLVIMMAVFGPFFLIAMVAVITLIVVPLVIASHQGGITAPIREMMSRLPAAAPGTTETAPMRQPNSGSMYFEESAPPDPVPAAPVEPPAAPALPPGEHHGGCYGKIKGLDFFVEHASVQNGVLHLKQGRGLFADREVVIFMLLKGSDPSGQQIRVSADRGSTSDPHIHLRWKSEEDDTPQSEVISKGYDLYLEFGRMSGQSLDGKIDLSIPGDRETRLAGTFIAKVTNQ